MRSARLAWFVLCAAASGFACASATEDSVSTDAPEAREGQPTYATYRWLWANESRKEFTATHSGEYYREDDPMSVRLQFWIDRIDQAVRAKVPSQLANVPPPKILIDYLGAPNAFVTGVPVRWNVRGQVSFSDIPDAEVRDGEAFSFILGPRGSVSDFLGDLGALPREQDEAGIDEVVQFANRGFANCRLAYDGQTLRFENGCSGRDKLVFKSEHARAVGINATGRWITVTRRMILSLANEEQMVAVLAHELGHYYRTHTMTPYDQYFYYYALGDANVADKPAPAPQFLAETQKLREKLNDRNARTFDEENRLMTDMRLGVYTQEQEADELSLEFLSAMGLSPTFGPDSQATLQKVIEAMPVDDDDSDLALVRAQSLDANTCDALRAKGFRDETGREVSVPVGYMLDPHHSFCFRIFNMTREIAAHHYVPIGEKPTPPGPAWADAVAAFTAEPQPPVER